MAVKVLERCSLCLVLGCVMLVAADCRVLVSGPRCLSMAAQGAYQTCHKQLMVRGRPIQQWYWHAECRHLKLHRRVLCRVLPCPAL